MLHHLIRGYCINRHGWTEIRNQPCCLAGHSRSHDTCSADISGRPHGSNTNGRRNFTLLIHGSVMNIFFIVYILLCIFCNLIHHLQRFSRIFSCRSLSGKHNCICAVINSICHICHFCSCRTWIADHRVQHLRSCDNRHITFIAFFYDHFLDMGYFLSRDFYAQIPSGYHDAIGSFYDFINILHTFSILDLCNNRNMLCVVFLKNFPDFFNAFGTPDKRGSNKINILLDTEKYIINIFFCNGRKLYFYVWYIYTLPFSKLSAVFYMTDNIAALDLFYLQFNQSVVNKDSVSRFYILSQSRISHTASRFISGHFLCIENKFAAFSKGYLLSSLQESCSDFGTFRIQEDCHRTVQLFSHIFQQIHTLSLLFVVSVGKVKPCHIHSVFHQGFHNRFLIRIRPHGADNLSTSHLFSSSYFFDVNVTVYSVTLYVGG